MQKKIVIEFVDPNVQEDIEKILPSILAQAIINKVESDNNMHKTA